MTSRIISKLPLAIFAAVFAALAFATVATTQAVTGTATVAAAQGYPHFHRGYYAWHGRYWAHRRYHPAYRSGPYHRFHAGFYTYF